MTDVTIHGYTDQQVPLCPHPDAAVFSCPADGSHHASTPEPPAMDDLVNAWLTALPIGLALGVLVNEASQHFTTWWNTNRPPPPDAPHHYPGRP